MGFLRAVTDALSITDRAQPGAAAAGQKPSTPGWYRHPEMVNTLCYWDGQGWTDKVQPIGGDASDAVAAGIFKVLAVLVVVAIVVFFGYKVVHANDDLDCAVRNTDHAAAGEPAENC